MNLPVPACKYFGKCTPKALLPTGRNQTAFPNKNVHAIGLLTSCQIKSAKVFLQSGVAVEAPNGSHESISPEFMEIINFCAVWLMFAITYWQ